MESLLQKIKQYFPNYRTSTLHNLLLLILCLLDGGMVNLYKLHGRVCRFTGKPTQSGSGYKRLIRIFDIHAYSRLWPDLLQCGAHRVVSVCRVSNPNICCWMVI